MTTKRIVFTKPCTAELLDVEVSAPKENEVTVALEYSAISTGTEKANFLGERNGIGVAEDAEAVFPRTVGYSAAGIVTEIGSEIKDLVVGDRVVVAWGKHQKQITVKRSKVVKIPDGVSSKEASMALIATFPLAAIRKTHLEIGESALVMGLGILGIFAVQELRAAGVYPIVAVDPIAERRVFALKMGADYALDPTEAEFVDKVKQITNGGANVCIEVTGLGIGLIQALECMQKMGRVALLGCTRSSKFEIDYYGKVHGRGISLIGAHTMARPKHESSAGLWTDEDDIKCVLSLIKGKRLNFKEMICEIVSPEEAQRVYDRLVNEKNFPIGVLFDWGRL
ncbi:MAG: zinc-binding alcohol dehydrogenase [Clostridia bacterium]|nr:zinc-binding alcohol dehydrogenase [Clostridia bacterium]